MKDYYRILQVHPEASQEVMNTAYRTLVRQFHPDLYHTHRQGVPKDAIDEKMRDINEAYQVLSNPSTRADYERRYRQSSPHSQLPVAKLALKTRLMRTFLWAVGFYFALTILVKPFLASPWLKLL